MRLKYEPASEPLHISVNPYTQTLQVRGKARVMMGEWVQVFHPPPPSTHTPLHLWCLAGVYEP